MEEWLLFDWIALHPGYITERNVKRAAAIEAHFADARLAFGNRTTVPTGKAANPIAIDRLPKRAIAYMNALIEDFAQGRHTLILRLMEEDGSRL